MVGTPPASFAVSGFALVTELKLEMVALTAAELFNGKMYEFRAKTAAKKSREIILRTTVGLVSQGSSLQQSVREKISVLLLELEASLAKVREGSNVKKLLSGSIGLFEWRHYRVNDDHRY